MNVTFIKEFEYYHNGHRRVVYGPGEADISEEVYNAAVALGALGGKDAVKVVPEKQDSRPKEAPADEVPAHQEQVMQAPQPRTYKSK